LEQQIMAIWQEVLQTSAAVGVHDDYWELGGTSLLAGVMMSKVNTHAAPCADSCSSDLMGKSSSFPCGRAMT
jgi:hypothetical protein